MGEETHRGKRLCACACACAYMHKVDGQPFTQEGNLEMPKNMITVMLSCLTLSVCCMMMQNPLETDAFDFVALGFMFLAFSAPLCEIWK